MRDRRFERPTINFFHSSLRAVLAECWTGFNPLALMAAKKLDLMLLKLLLVRPAATGLTVASLALIAGRSRGMRAGSSPTNNATRLIEERRSRNRVSERALSLRAMRTSLRFI